MLGRSHAHAGVPSCRCVGSAASRKIPRTRMSTLLKVRGICSFKKDSTHPHQYSPEGAWNLQHQRKSHALARAFSCKCVGSAASGSLEDPKKIPRTYTSTPLKVRGICSIKESPMHLHEHSPVSAWDLQHQGPWKIPRRSHAPTQALPRRCVESAASKKVPRTCTSTLL